MSKNKRKNAPGSATRDVMKQNAAAKERTEEVVVLVVEPTVSETPVEETPVVETSVEEALVVETPVEETPVVETPVEETPVEETPVEETPVEEKPVEETPVEEKPVEETPVVETPVEETPVEEKPVEETPVAKDDNNFKKAIITGGAIGLVLLFGTFVVMLCLLFRSNKGPVENLPANETTTIETTETTATTENTSTTETETQKPVEEFDIKAFEKKATNLANSYGNTTNAAAHVATITSNFGVTNVEEQVKLYGEITLAREIATLVTNASIAMGKAYADELGTEYLSVDEYFDAQLEKTDAYKDLTGNNPETVLMNLKDPDNPEYCYEELKANPDAILALAKKVLADEEYTLFKEWYTVRNQGYAEANKVEKYISTVQQQILTSEGTLEFFELQMKMVDAGMTTTNANGEATTEYVEFVQNNFYIVIAGS